MQDKFCSIHESRIVAACLFEGCTQHFLCIRCVKCHPDTHDSKIQDITSLVEDVSWIKPNEEQKDSQVTQLASYYEEKKSLATRNLETLKDMIAYMIEYLQKKQALWIAEVESLLSLEENLALKEVFTKVEENLEVLNNLNLGEGGIFDKVNKVKDFKEKLHPNSDELCKQVQNALAERKLDQDRCTDFRDDILDLIESMKLGDLLISNKPKRQKASEQIALLQQELESLNKKMNDQLEARSREVESLKKENVALRTQLESDTKISKQKETELTEINKDLQKQITKLTADLKNMTTNYNKLIDTFSVKLNEASNIINKNHLKNIKNWIPNPLNNPLATCQLKLLYRGTRDGFTSAKANEKRSSFAPTISLIKSKEQGRIFGGYSSKSWKAPQNAYVEDQEAFLFSLTHGEKYPIKDPAKAVYLSKDYIVAFGQEDIDLKDGCNISQQGPSKFPFSYHCCKFPNNSSSEAKAYLAGSDKFTVEEIEIYQIIWSE